MGEVMLPGRIRRESQFVGGLTGACGPNAAAMAEAWADQSPTLGTLDVFRRMCAAGRCDANGVSTMAALMADARAAGYDVEVLPYREPMAEADWRGFLDRHVGARAVVCEVANGQALRDARTGLGENASNLRYHFLTVVGEHPGGASRVAGGATLPAGWWCCDGDNRAVGDVLQFYADATLAAARPCAAMAIAPRTHAPAGGGAGGGATMAVPAGWHDDGATLTAPNGVAVVHGFRAEVLDHGWDAMDWPLAPEAGCASVEPGNASIGPGTRQDFRLTSLGWTSSRGVYRIWVGQDILALRAQSAAADALRTQVGDLQHQIDDLRAQLDAARAAGQQGGPAEAAIRALAAALAEVK